MGQTRPNPSRWYHGWPKCDPSTGFTRLKKWTNGYYRSERHGWTVDVIRSHWNWAPGSNFLNNSGFALTWRLIRNALPLLGLNYRADQTDMPDCACCGSGLEETAEHAFYSCERVRTFWDHIGELTARIDSKQAVLLDVGYVVNNVLPPFQDEKRVVFQAILAVARMVIWTTRKKGLYDDAKQL